MWQRWMIKLGLRTIICIFGCASYVSVERALDPRRGLTMRTLFQRLLWEEDGPTAVEYAVMLALIIIVAIAGVRAAGTTVNSSFDDSKSKIESAMGS